eukprot:TRINITY_DN47658_c0_g1_i1.p1 TRINITY_DN47658_c0_g1~~TRINITY_DN47658_c0_g1_i1.p1  ORF type:complete len:623 (+),score=192.62 TRINITY_DN47658_c0_g1_i1:61-1869(+)
MAEAGPSATGAVTAGPRKRKRVVRVVRRTRRRVGAGGEKPRDEAETSDEGFDDVPSPQKRRVMPLSRRRRTETKPEVAGVEQRSRRRPTHLLCLDFEATCDNTESFPRADMELIEFAYGIVDVAAGKVCREGRDYIKPLYSPVTAFCTRLTGIKAETAAGGCSLEQAVARCADAVQSLPPGSRVVAVTHGTWDLGCQLRREAARKGVGLPKCLTSAFDIRDEVLKWAGNSGNITDLSLRGLCAAVGIRRVGTNHSGLDDALTVAAIAQELLDTTGDRMQPDADVLCEGGERDYAALFSRFLEEKGTAVRIKGAPRGHRLHDETSSWAEAAGAKCPLSFTGHLPPHSSMALSVSVVAVCGTHEDARKLLEHRGLFGLCRRWVETYPATAEEVKLAEAIAEAEAAAAAEREAAEKAQPAAVYIPWDIPTASPVSAPMSEAAALLRAAEERRAVRNLTPAARKRREAATGRLAELQRRVSEKRSKEAEDSVQWPDEDTKVLSFGKVPKGLYERAGDPNQKQQRSAVKPTLESLDEGLRMEVEAFAEINAPGTELMLPQTLSSLQRKHVHSWADHNGVSHASVGKGARRRLRLFVPVDEEEEAEED